MEIHDKSAIIMLCSINVRYGINIFLKDTDIFKAKLPIIKIIDSSEIAFIYVIGIEIM